MESDTTHHTILAVNDSPDHLELMSYQLRQAGYHVLTAAGGDEGVEAARRARPDLVISDVTMPQVGGIELCRRLRADAGLRTTPILLVTALRKDAASVVEGLAAGADDYLEAPYEPMVLVARAARLLELRKANEELERRVAERTAQLESASQELESERDERGRAEAELRALFAAMSDVIIVLDAQGRYLKIAPTSPGLLYRPSDELLGRRLHDIFPAESADAFLGHVRRALDTRAPVEIEYSLTISGEEVWFAGTVAPLMEDSVIWVVRDVTARRQTEEALWRVGEQLRQSQKLEAVGQLAGGIAHDFNNLLTAIGGQSELLLRQLGDDAPALRRVEEIRKAAGRAASLTHQLLAFSRKQILQPKVVNINEVVSETGDMLRRLIGEDIWLVTVLAPGLWSVLADPAQVTQVVINLAVNARDAMPRGGRLTVETANVHLDEEYAARHVSAKAGQYVMLAVSDTGVGIDAETQKHIFEPYFTTKPTGKGTGLGLSTVYGIVKQSGGNVWVYSEPGHGASFKIYLPRVEETEAADEPPVRAELPRGTETILLVEDEDAVRAVAKDILESCGYRVLEAGGGEEALLLCGRQEGPINLLVTDVVMPGVGGKELSRRLLELRPQVKVLYMSGYTDNAIVHHSILYEGVNFIQKPFTPEALSQKVREVLDATS